MFGQIATSLFLAGASYFDIKTAGEEIPLNFLRVWFASSVTYAAYSAYLRFDAQPTLLQAWGLTIIVVSLIAFMLHRLRLCGEADCWALASTTIFSPFTALQSLLLAAAAYFAAYSVPLILLNLARREKAVPWWAYGLCVRLTPRLSRIKFIKWRRNTKHQILTIPDAENVPLDARAGDLASPFLVFLPFYFIAFLAAWAPPIQALYASWVNLNPTSMEKLLGQLP